MLQIACLIFLGVENMFRNKKITVVSEIFSSFARIFQQQTKILKKFSIYGIKSFTYQIRLIQFNSIFKSIFLEYQLVIIKIQFIKQLHQQKHQNMFKSSFKFPSQSKILILICFLVLQVASLHFNQHKGSFKDEGYWGDWSNQLTQDQRNGNPSDMFICGAQLQLEKKQGGGDDTAANGITFKFCSARYWGIQSNFTYQGIYGTWRKMVTCPKGEYVCGFQSRIQKPTDGDDTAFNGLKIYCRDPNKPYQSKNLHSFVVDSGYWGDWNSPHISKTQFAYSFKVRIQGPQGGSGIEFIPEQSKLNKGSGDDTSMNGLQIFTKKFGN